MTYHICNLHDARVLCVHRQCTRFCIRPWYDIPNHLTIFETTNFEGAKLYQEFTSKRWHGSWVVVNTLGEVVK